MDLRALEQAVERRNAAPIEVSETRGLALWTRIWRATPEGVGREKGGGAPVDSGWIEALYARWSGELLGFALRQRDGRVQEAEDLVAETFERFMEAADPARRGQERALLFRILRGKILDRQRAEGRRRMEALRDDAPDGRDALRQVCARLELEALAERISALKLLWQDVVLMTMRGDTDQEIASELQISPAYARQIRRRARRALAGGER